MSNNPYTQAAGAYGKTSTIDESDQSTMEGQLLLKAAQKLQVIQEQLDTENKPSLEDIDDVLTYNRKLWTVFADEATNDANDLPDDLKNNIASLAVFIFKHTVNVQAEPTNTNIATLIDINRQIASGLLKRPQQVPDVPTNTKEDQDKPDKKAEDLEQIQPSSSTDMSA